MKIPSLIGVIHLPPLPGAPGAGPAARALSEAGFRAVQEAKALEKAGFEALILENFGDVPFFKTQVPPETIASLSVIAAAVREAVRLPLGINVLRNDARAALAIAATVGCDFIRVNVLSGVTATDQGLIEGDAAFLVRERERLGAQSVSIFADVHVKHAQSLSSRSMTLAIEEVSHRGGADAVIITGPTTGRLLESAFIQEASRAARATHVPLLLGSGATAQNLRELRGQVHGVIVGSALRRGGRAGAALDLAACRKFVQAFSKARKKPSRK